MDGSRMIRVLKRDRSAENYDPQKFAASLWRPMQQTRSGRYRDALDLAMAVGVYLQRTGRKCVSSAALFEMAVKILRRVGFHKAARAMESHSRARKQARRNLRIRHAERCVTWWEKGWLADIGAKCWNLMPSTARIIAGQVERQLLAGPDRIVNRSAVLEIFNDQVARFGLADAVPVAQ